ncbi:hypothetical protein SH528x_005881 [Novipirellula sp. SH528]|uniref:hypothetical protein n=1 Tax=Novipirellula sp. SH528 TaxID=3454466 RepID=UPI003FA14F0D
MNRHNRIARGGTLTWAAKTFVLTSDIGGESFFQPILLFLTTDEVRLLIWLAVLALATVSSASNRG